MAISKIAPPMGSTLAASQRLTAFNRATGSVSPREAGGGIQSISKGSLPLYQLDLQPLAQDGAFGDRVKPVGWKYLVDEGDDAKCVEVVGDKAYAIDHGEAARNIARALQYAEDLSHDGNYEARILTFGRAGNSVLWLHPEGGTDERFFTMGPQPQEVVPSVVLQQAAESALVRQKSRSQPLREADKESGG